jgi:phosphate transport system substrate-binding protein
MGWSFSVEEDSVFNEPENNNEQYDNKESKGAYRAVICSTSKRRSIMNPAKTKKDQKKSLLSGRLFGVCFDFPLFKGKISMKGGSMNRKKMYRFFALFFILSIQGVGAGEVVKVDPAILSYKRKPGIGGNLTSIGSDTMNNLMTLWAEGYRRFYPTVRIQIEGKGSSTAPPALLEGTSDLGPMSRPMKDEEKEKIVKKYGLPPLEIRVALDGLSIYVHRENPIKEISIEEIDAVFSKTRRCGWNKDILFWGDLGLTGGWEKLPIRLYGRNSASGTYGYFKDHALCKGDFKDEVKEQPGSASVVQAVEKEKTAIGYSGIGYATSGVREVPVSKKKGEPAYEPTYENVLSGKYPLSRYLYIYVVKVPGKPIPPLVKEFLLYVLSREGQEVAIKDGYFPLPSSIVEEERKKILND